MVVIEDDWSLNGGYVVDDVFLDHDMMKGEKSMMRVGMVKLGLGFEVEGKDRFFLVLFLFLL